LDHTIIEDATPNKSQEEWKTSNTTPIIETPANGPDSNKDFIKKTWEEGE
jgi:hypothetical protein